MTSQAGVPAPGLAPEASEHVSHTLAIRRRTATEAIPAEPSLTALPATAV